MAFILLVGATVALNTLAQILLKSGSGQFLLNGYLVGGILAYGLSTLMYISVLSKLNLSLAYPLIIGLTVIATTFAGAYFFQEKVEPIAWLGIGLMLSGIGAVALGRP
jgi:small multidrug resistance pump